MRTTWIWQREPDPVVAAWDRHLAGDRTTELSPLITRLEQSHRAPAPDPHFIKRLEDQMMETSLSLQSIQAPASGRRGVAGVSWRMPRFATGFHPARVTAAVAIVALLVASLAMIASMGNGKPAGVNTIPARSIAESSPAATDSSMETLLQVTIDPAAFGSADPSAWDSMEFALVSVAAGSGFNIDLTYFSNSDGAATFYVLAGEMALTSNQPVQSIGREEPPVLLPDASALSVREGEAVVVAMTSGAEFENTGSGELHLLGAYGYDFIGPMSTMPPDGYTELKWNFEDIDPLQPGPVTLKLTVTELGAYQTLRSVELPDNRLIGVIDGGDTRMLAGDHLSVSPGEKGVFIRDIVVEDFVQGNPLTIFNADPAEPAVIYLMHFESANDTAAALVDSTPVTTAQLGETLLSVTYDPADIGSADPSTWTTHELFVGRVKSHESFSMDHPFFTGAPGTAAFRVLSGELTVSSPGPVMVVDENGQTALHESTTDQLVHSGETVLLSMKTPAQMRNDGAEELTLLYWGGYYPEFANTIPPDFTQL